MSWNETRVIDEAPKGNFTRLCAVVAMRKMHPFDGPKKWCSTARQRKQERSAQAPLAKFWITTSARERSLTRRH
jgi:hypothetical protein